MTTPTTTPPAAGTTNGNGHEGIGQAVEFLGTIFAPGDTILLRPIETWIEAGKKKSAVDYKGISYRTMGVRDGSGQWQPAPHVVELAIRQQTDQAAQTRCNVFFGVCPRFGSGGKFDMAWQIRTVRALWSDVDGCTVDEALARVEKASLPRPSAVVSSGNGAHLYWILTDPVLIDDCGDPPPVLTEWTEKDGKKKPRKYILDGQDRLYLDVKQNVPPLSPRGQHVQDILTGIASKIGGDHTTDLSRLLRGPGTLNRKDQRNGRKPKPCTLVECDPSRRYRLEDFAQCAKESPDRKRREKLAAVKLPKPRKISDRKRDNLEEHILACRVAEVGKRSEADFGLCCFAIENRIDKADVWAEVSAVGKFAEAGERYFDTTWAKAESRAREKILTRIEKKAAKAEARREKQDNASSQPMIIVGYDVKRVADEGIAALASQDDLFQRGGVLVHVVDDGEPPRGIQRPANAHRIVPVRLPHLRELLGVSATWYHEVGDNMEQCHPPERIVSAVEARGSWQGIRRLEGLTKAPILRADGTVANQPGYDSQTGILLHLPHQFPEVAAKPTKDDAVRAVKELCEVVEDFPFEKPEHKAAWLAGTLTPFARFAFHGPAPMFMIDANTRGCGKSLLADITGQLVSGQEMPRMAIASDDDEMRKRITAIAVFGEPTILLDNIPASGSLGCPSLDAALTATSWSDRLLGRTETVTVPLYATWYATGNNIILAADTARRVCHIRLETLLESPERRSGFRHPKLLQWVRQERPRLAVAAVTILAAYCQAGRPNMGLENWGSFDAWHELVSQALVWAGQADPGESRSQLTEQSDREAAALRQFLTALKAADPSDLGLTVGEMLKRAAEYTTEAADLRAALVELVPTRDGKFPGAQSIGMKLHHMRHRVVGGLYLDRANNDSTNTAIWKVRVAESGSLAAGTSGTKGTNFQPSRERGRICAGGEEKTDTARQPAGTSSGSPASPGQVWSPSDETALAEFMRT